MNATIPEHHKETEPPEGSQNVFSVDDIHLTQKIEKQCTNSPKNVVHV